MTAHACQADCYPVNLPIVPAPRPRPLHGFLGVCLLSLLEGGPDYGLSLGQRLAEAGLTDIPGGTLYPALVRLERQGLVEVSRRVSDSGPPRKYFTLTPDGHAELSIRRAEWRTFVTTLSRLIEPAPRPARGEDRR